MTATRVMSVRVGHRHARVRMMPGVERLYWRRWDVGERLRVEVRRWRWAGLIGQ